MTMKIRIYPSENTTLQEQLDFLNTKFCNSTNSIGEFLGWNEINITDLLSFTDSENQRVLDLTGRGVRFEKIHQTKRLIGFENFESHFVGSNRCGFRIETENLFINFTTNRDGFEREWIHVVDVLSGRGSESRPSFKSMTDLGFSEDKSDRFSLDYKRYTDDFIVCEKWDHVNDLEGVRWKKRTTLTVELNPNQCGTQFGELWHDEISNIIRQTGYLTTQMIFDDSRPSDFLNNLPKKHMEGFQERSVQAEISSDAQETLP